MINKKFEKVVVLDTIIFYEEHERLLKQLVNKPKIERVPLVFNQKIREWELPDDYEMDDDANIIIWPSSLPDSFEGMTYEIHSKLKTSLCYVEESLQDNIHEQNLLNRVMDADCIITCWTVIPDVVLEIIKPKAILTWTHEYSHRLNIEKAKEKNIYTACVNDYGTDSVAELIFYMMLELNGRNTQDQIRKINNGDTTIEVLLNLYNYFRKVDQNEKKTRKGKFSHQFLKRGHAINYYKNIKEFNIDDIIPFKLIENKNIGLINSSFSSDKLTKVLEKGFKTNIEAIEKIDIDDANFYKFCSTNEVVILDSNKISKLEFELVESINNGLVIDLSKLKNRYNSFDGKTIGIIGMGRIGQRLAEIAISFGLNVIYSGNKKNVSYPNVSLDELLTSSDIISISIKPHTNKELIGAKEIKKIKNGCLFINTSDANIVNQEALIKRVLNNEIFIAMDVYQGLATTKTLGLDDNFRGKIKNQLSNHIFTYRAGWVTQESLKVKTYKLLGNMIKALSYHSKN